MATLPCAGNTFGSDGRPWYLRRLLGENFTRRARTKFPPIQCNKTAVDLTPIMNVIKKTGLASNGTSINRIVLLVVGIEQEVEREPFDVCLIFQNRVVQENKRDPVFPRPQTEHSSAIFFLLLLLPLFVKYSRQKPFQRTRMVPVRSEFQAVVPF